MSIISLSYVRMYVHLGRVGNLMLSLMLERLSREPAAVDARGGGCGTDEVELEAAGGVLAAFKPLVVRGSRPAGARGDSVRVGSTRIFFARVAPSTRSSSSSELESCSEAAATGAGG